MAKPSLLKAMPAAESASASHARGPGAQRQRVLKGIGNSVGFGPGLRSEAQRHTCRVTGQQEVLADGDS
eukprot:11210833-Lingulodinium_polyedra.AAC.1